MPPDHSIDTNQLPRRFGWLYFQFVGADGALIILLAHETDLFGLTSEHYVSLFYRPSDGGPERRFRLPLTRAPTGLSIVGPPLSIERSDEKVLINLRADGIAFSAEVTPLVRKVAPPQRVLSQVGQRVHYWTAEIPHGRFAAQLALDGDEEISLTGRAYCDRNWGSLPPQAAADSWFWAQLSTEEEALLFYEIRTQDDRLRRWGRRFGETGEPCELSFRIQFPEWGADPLRWHETLAVNLEWNANAGSCRAGLTLASLLRSHGPVWVGDDAASYCRWEAGLTCAATGQRFAGVAEVFYVDRGVHAAR